MGTVSIKTISPVAKLGLWRMEEPWERMRETLDMPASETKTLESISKPKRRQEWLACRALLSEMTGQYAVISYDAQRKPHLTGSDTQISMSHSGEYVCVYLSTGAPVGVDVQQMKPSIAKGAFYFLSDAELQWAEPEDNLQMHLIWSAKESVFKYAGNAAVDLKKHIVINPFSSNQNGHFEVKLQKDGLDQLIQIHFDTFEDYVLTWTV